MSEERQDAPTDGGEQGAAPDPTVEVVPTPVVGGDTPDDAPASEPGAWREDWREAFSGGDEKRLKELKRFATPEAFAKAGFTARERISQGVTDAPEPPEGAGDVELAAWRKQKGLPEAPEGYGISFPAEMKPSETDKAELGQFLQFMHGRHVPPPAAKAAFEFYMTARAEGQARAEEALDEVIQQHTADLRRTFPGSEYTRNFGKNGKGGLVNDYLQGHFSGPDGNVALKEILNARTPSGVPLWIHKDFLKGLANMARDVATEDQLIGGDGAGGGKSLDAEYADLVALPRLTDAQRQRMIQIQEAKLAREVRQGRSRAA